MPGVTKSVSTGSQKVVPVGRIWFYDVVVGLAIVGLFVILKLYKCLLSQTCSCTVAEACSGYLPSELKGVPTVEVINNPVADSSSPVCEADATHLDLKLLTRSGAAIGLPSWKICTLSQLKLSNLFLILHVFIAATWPGICAQLPGRALTLLQFTLIGGRVAVVGRQIFDIVFGLRSLWDGNSVFSAALLFPVSLSLHWPLALLQCFLLVQPLLSYERFTTASGLWLRMLALQFLSGFLMPTAVIGCLGKYRSCRGQLSSPPPPVIAKTNSKLSENEAPCCSNIRESNSADLLKNTFFNSTDGIMASPDIAAKLARQPQLQHPSDKHDVHPSARQMQPFRSCGCGKACNAGSPKAADAVAFQNAAKAVQQGLSELREARKLNLRMPAHDRQAAAKVSSLYKSVARTTVVSVKVSSDALSFDRDVDKLVHAVRQQASTLFKSPAASIGCCAVPGCVQLLLPVVEYFDSTEQSVPLSCHAPGAAAAQQHVMKILQECIEQVIPGDPPHVSVWWNDSTVAPFDATSGMLSPWLTQLPCPTQSGELETVGCTKDADQLEAMDIPCGTLDVTPTLESSKDHVTASLPNLGEAMLGPSAGLPGLLSMNPLCLAAGQQQEMCLWVTKATLLSNATGQFATEVRVVLGSFAGDVLVDEEVLVELRDPLDPSEADTFLVRFLVPSQPQTGTGLQLLLLPIVAHKSPQVYLSCPLLVLTAEAQHELDTAFAFARSEIQSQQAPQHELTPLPTFPTDPLPQAPLPITFTEPTDLTDAARFAPSTPPSYMIHHAAWQYAMLPLLSDMYALLQLCHGAGSPGPGIGRLLNDLAESIMEYLIRQKMRECLGCCMEAVAELSEQSAFREFVQELELTHALPTQLQALAAGEQPSDEVSTDPILAASATGEPEPSRYITTEDTDGLTNALTDKLTNSLISDNPADCTEASGPSSSVSAGSTRQRCQPVMMKPSKGVASLSSSQSSAPSDVEPAAADDSARHNDLVKGTAWWQSLSRLCSRVVNSLVGRQAGMSGAYDVNGTFNVDGAQGLGIAHGLSFMGLNESARWRVALMGSVLGFNNVLEDRYDTYRLSRSQALDACCLLFYSAVLSVTCAKATRPLNTFTVTNLVSMVLPHFFLLFLPHLVGRQRQSTVGMSAYGQETTASGSGHNAAAQQHRSFTQWLHGKMNIFLSVVGVPRSMLLAMLRMVLHFFVCKMHMNAGILSLYVLSLSTVTVWDVILRYSFLMLQAEGRPKRCS